jgi:feruloyl-CoA synthase
LQSGTHAARARIRGQKNGAGNKLRRRLFAPAAVQVTRRSDGAILLRSPQPLGDYGRCIGEWLVRWAETAPDQAFLMERGSEGTWTGVTYLEAMRDVRSIAAWLLRAGCSVERPVAILCDNSVRHALIALAALHVGIPVSSVSSAYSLVSSDFGKLKSVIAQIRNSDNEYESGLPSCVSRRPAPPHLHLALC